MTDSPNFILPPGSRQAVGQSGPVTPSPTLNEPMPVKLSAGTGRIGGSLLALGNISGSSYSISTGSFTQLSYTSLNASVLTVGSFGTSGGHTNAWYGLPAGSYEISFAFEFVYTSGAITGYIDAYVEFLSNSSLGTGVNATYAPLWSSNSIPVTTRNGFTSSYVTIPEGGFIAAPTTSMMSAGSALSGGSDPLFPNSVAFLGRYLGDG